MIDQKVVRNYASCLFDNAKSDSECQKILEQISLFNEILLTSELVRFALYSPIVSKFDKLKLVNGFIEKFQFEKIVAQFFKVVVRNSRFEILSSVIARYKQLLNESRGIKFVTVESVEQQPNKKVTAIVKKYLENKLEKIIELKTIQNESLIGGVVIKYDSFLYDYSVAGTLDRVGKLAKVAKI